MSINYFCIGNNVDNNQAEQGFVRPQSIKSTEIEDSLFVSGTSLNKIGSSIPTPFARLYLFNLAFDQVNAFYDQHHTDLGNDAFKGVPDNDDTEKIVPTSHHYLVSECLDMLEFIYEYGNEDKFKIVEWVVKDEIRKLTSSPSQEIRDLGKALEASHEDPAFAGFDKIYIFMWDKIIIGGTSPVSLVYTSPNLRRLLSEKGLANEFKGGGGNILFSNTALPLNERSVNFREFIYRYYQCELCNSPKLDGSAIADYIGNVKNIDRNIANNINQQNLTLSGLPLQYNDAPIRTAGVGLYYCEHIFTGSDYIMCPTTDIYKNQQINGAKVEVPQPLALTPNGVDGLDYVGRSWNRTTDKIPQSLSPYYTKRTLPGTNFNYPFVTPDDFLEEKIVDLSYPINKDRFVTACAEDSKFLLPLKKEFFRFFRIEDIPSMVGVYITREHGEITKVKISIKIPLKNNNSVVFAKEYDFENDVVGCYSETRTFDLSIFPSFKLPVNEGGPDDNVYDVMLGTTIESASINMHFYNVKDLCNADGNQHIQNVSSSDRSVAQQANILTRHYNVPSSFDFAEIEIKKSDIFFHALIIPQFSEAIVDGFKMVFGVDFGTTNTYVAYAKRDDDDTLVTTDMIQPFDIGSNDRQIMTLNKDGDVGYFSKFTTVLNREFVPQEIGVVGNLKYPMRTTTWEKLNANGNLELFKTINIGFNYDNELSTVNSGYKTNIKWARNDAKAPSRLKEYFKELLWMMKTKSVLNGGGVDFKVVATFPQSMSIREVSNFRRAWIEASRAIKAGANIQFEYESAAPYYSFCSDLKYGKPYMNLDIGGGTTDILHIKPNAIGKDHAVIFSAIFAANDIWGDGKNDATTAKQNGFVTFFPKTDHYKNTTIKKDIDSVIKNAESSADVMSYLFTHDTDTDISNAIKSSDVMMQVPIVHFCSLIYYVALIIDMAELEMPTTITFTGLGSQYIKLICEDEVTLSKLINLIFKYYGKIAGNKDLKDANISVVFAPEPKKVTASGALIKSTRQSCLVPDACCCHGYDGEEYGKPVKVSELNGLKQKVMDSLDDFLNLFNDGGIQNVINIMGITLSGTLKQDIKDYAGSSFDLMVAESSKESGQNTNLQDPIFFWPLKESLYQLTKKCAAKITSSVQTT